MLSGTFGVFFSRIDDLIDTIDALPQAAVVVKRVLPKSVGGSSSNGGRESSNPVDLVITYPSRKYHNEVSLTLRCTDGISGAASNERLKIEPKSKGDVLQSEPSKSSTHNPESLTLRPGQTTARALIAEIADSAGVTIELSPALGQRRLTAFLNHASLSTSLRCIAALNDWRLSEGDKTRFTLGRPAALPPRSPGRFPKAIQTALPLDFRTFLTIGLTPDELARGGNDDLRAQIAGIIARFSDPHTELDARPQDTMIRIQKALAERRVREAVIPFRCKAASQTAASRLAASLGSNAAGSVAKRVKNLSSRQQGLLLTTLLMERLSNPMDYQDVVFDRLPPYVYDRSLLEIRFTPPSTIHFGATTRENGVSVFVGGGAEVPPRPGQDP